MNTTKKSIRDNMPMILGAAIGAALGPILLRDNIFLGISLGLSFAVMMAASFKNVRMSPPRTAGITGALVGLLVGAAGAVLVGFLHGAHYAVYGPGEVGYLLGYPFKSEYYILAPLGTALGLAIGSVIDARKAQ